MIGERLRSRMRQLLATKPVHPILKAAGHSQRGVYKFSTEDRIDEAHRAALGHDLMLVPCAEFDEGTRDMGTRGSAMSEAMTIRRGEAAAKRTPTSTSSTTVHTMARSHQALLFAVESINVITCETQPRIS